MGGPLNSVWRSPRNYQVTQTALFETMGTRPGKEPRGESPWKREQATDILIPEERTPLSPGGLGPNMVGSRTEHTR